MVALVWVAASTVAAWFGMEAYEYMTRQQRIDACVVEVRTARPKSDVKEIIKACEIIVR